MVEQVRHFMTSLHCNGGGSISFRQLMRLYMHENSLIANTDVVNWTILDVGSGRFVVATVITSSPIVIIVSNVVVTFSVVKIGGNSIFQNQYVTLFELKVLCTLSPENTFNLPSMISQIDSSLHSIVRERTNLCS